MLIGWNETDITPQRVIGLDGQFFERISDTVETPITVTALAIEADNDALVICSCDLLGVGEKLVDRVRQLLAARSLTGLDPQKVIINATHTHTSYVYDNSNRIEDTSSLSVLKRYIPADRSYVSLVPPEAGEAMDRYEALEYIAVRIADSVAAAWNTRSEGSYATGFGRAAVGMNRRVCYRDGSAKMWGDTNSTAFDALEGGCDSGIELLFTYDIDAHMTGMIVNIACPSQIMEHRSVISSDYWGKVKILLRREYGADLRILGLCSPAGDLCPRDLIRWVEPETPIQDPNIRRDHVYPHDADPSMFDMRGTWVVARRIVSEIRFAVEEATARESTPRLVHLVERLPIPLRRVSESDRDAAEAALHTYLDGKTDAFSFDDLAAMHVHAGTLARCDLQKTVENIPIELHVIRLGNLVFATDPFELFLDYGNRIRARSCARQTFLIQLACGYYGYLPTVKAEMGGHYSAYVSSGFAGHEGGEILTETTLARIFSLFGLEEDTQ